MFFLAKWIPVKDKYTNDLWVEISSQVVNGLFTITGVRVSFSYACALCPVADRTNAHAKC